MIKNLLAGHETNFLEVIEDSTTHITDLNNVGPTYRSCGGRIVKAPPVNPRTYIYRCYNIDLTEGS